MLLEAKFEAICRMVFGVRIEVSEWQPSEKEHSTEANETPVSQGTSSNPIIIEEDPALEVSKLAKEPQSSSPPGACRIFGKRTSIQLHIDIA